MYVGYVFSLNPGSVIFRCGERGTSSPHLSEDVIGFRPSRLRCIKGIFRRRTRENRLLFSGVLPKDGQNRLVGREAVLAVNPADDYSSRSFYKDIKTVVQLIIKAFKTYDHY